VKKSDQQKTAARVVVKPGKQNRQRKMGDYEPRKGSFIAQACSQKLRQVLEAPDYANDIFLQI
jgi:hypothetical protein